jgi:ribonuclease E
VEGPEGYEAASRFMSMLMPGHTPKVVEYSDTVPLFQRFGVEQQLEGMYQPVVQLKSGGYIVINPTEALVAIDINSGRSTREYGIEETATKTNLEAAEEIGRQLRLRDMAGLVVIDFIDMEVPANNRRVEKAMKDALRNDRARIQIGRISAFGLLEMSRQRLRTGILEASTHICPMCEGTGMVRSVSSAALAALRALEAEALRGRASEFTLRAGDEVAVYILNRKRIELAELEELYGVSITTVPDESLIGPNFAIDSAGPPPTKKVEMKALPALVRIEDDPDDLPGGSDDEDDGEERSERGGRNGKRRRRRGSRGDRDETREDAPAETNGRGAVESGEDVADADDADNAPRPGETAAETEARTGRKRRRRGRRGRRDGAPRDQAVDVAETPAETIVEAPAAEPANDDAPAKPRSRRRRKADVEAVPDVMPEAPAPAAEPLPVAAEAEQPAAKTPRKRTSRAKAAAPEAAPAVEAPVEAAPEAEAPAKPKRAPRKTKAAAAEATAEAAVSAPVAAAPAAEPEPEAPTGPPKKGWWQRTFG